MAHIHIYASTSRPALDRKYRSELDIYSAILDFIRSSGSVKKTHLMNACNLNSYNASKYLGRLVNANLLAERKVGREIYYTITAKGMLTSILLRTIQSLLDSNASEWHRECRSTIEKIADEEGVELVKDVYIVGLGGVRFPFSYYAPATNTALVVADSDGLDLSLILYFFAVGAAVALDKLSKLVIVAPPATAEIIRSAVSSDNALVDKIVLLSGCNGSIREFLSR